MRILDKIGFTLVLLAGALVIGREWLALPWMMPAALVAVGLVACVGGFRAMVGGVIRGGTTGASYRVRFEGASARWVGVALLLGGAFVVAMAATDLLTSGGASRFAADLATGSPKGAPRRRSGSQA